MVDVKAFFEVGLLAVLKVVEPVASSVRPLVGELVFLDGNRMGCLLERQMGFRLGLKLGCEEGVMTGCCDG